MRFRALALILPLALSGCNYVHLGRAPLNDAQLAEENRRLAQENSQLQQQLGVTQRQGDTLKQMIDRGDSSGQLTNQLTETTRQLAALRADYARLQTQQQRLAVTPADLANPAGQIQNLKAQLSDTEDKLAGALRTYTSLEEENSRVRGEMEKVQSQNSTLAGQVRDLAAQNEATQRALSQLNTEMLRQKEALALSEQQGYSLRGQLNAANERIVTLGGARTGSATANAETMSGFSGIPDARFETSSAAARNRASGVTAPTRPGVTALEPAAAAARTHVIAPGDTLSRISQRYYGTPDRWRDILAANGDVIRSEGTLVIGRVLRIP